MGTGKTILLADMLNAQYSVTFILLYEHPCVKYWFIAFGILMEIFEGGRLSWIFISFTDDFICRDPDDILLVIISTDYEQI